MKGLKDLITNTKPINKRHSFFLLRTYMKVMPLIPLLINIGILIGFISDYFLSYHEVTYVTFGIMFVFLCTYSIFPDTPKQLYKNLRRDECIKSMRVYCDTKSLEHKIDHFYWIEAKKIKNILKSERSSISDYGKLKLVFVFNGIVIAILTFSKYSFNRIVANIRKVHFTYDSSSVTRMVFIKSIHI